MTAGNDGDRSAHLLGRPLPDLVLDTTGGHGQALRGLVGRPLVLYVGRHPG